MFLISDPNDTLIGARDTCVEANKLIEKHAMVLTCRQVKEASLVKKKPLTDEQAWQLYNQLLTQYKIEEIPLSSPQTKGAQP